jgi:pyruvate-ferredoxin/flavodoxin oxidoreductase
MVSLLYPFVKDFKFGGTVVLNSPWKIIEEIEIYLSNSLKYIFMKNKNCTHLKATKILFELGIFGKINMIMQATSFQLS